MAAKPALRVETGRGTCVSVVPLHGCAPARGFSSPDQMDGAMSPDGKSLYVASTTSASIGIVNVSPRTGAIKQAKGSGGCLLERGGDSDVTVKGCGKARGFGVGTYGVAVSPDGDNVYVVSDNRDDPGDPPASSIAVFARRSNGSLKQLSGAAGCLASSPGDSCAVLAGLSGLKVSVSPDGARVYVTGPNLWVFARHPGTGALTLSGCQSMVGGCELRVHPVRARGERARVGAGRPPRLRGHERRAPARGQLSRRAREPGGGAGAGRCRCRCPSTAAWRRACRAARWTTGWDPTCRIP